MLGKVMRWPFIKHLGWVIYHGEGQLVCRFCSMGSGLMPQIHISHKSDIILWVSSRVVFGSYARNKKSNRTSTYLCMATI